MERINLLDHPGHRRLRAWASGNPTRHLYREVAVGRLADGRVYAARVGRGWTGAWLARDERQAADAVDSWMVRAGGEWQPVPASYDSSGLPADGGSWVRRGGEWWPADQPNPSPVWGLPSPADGGS